MYVDSCIYRIAIHGSFVLTNITCFRTTVPINLLYEQSAQCIVYIKPLHSHKGHPTHHHPLSTSLPLMSVQRHSQSITLTLCTTQLTIQRIHIPYRHSHHYGEQCEVHVPLLTKPTCIECPATAIQLCRAGLTAAVALFECGQGEVGVEEEDG